MSAVPATRPRPRSCGACRSSWALVGAIQHEHKHAHVVLNPRDMTPKQRAQLKAVLLSIERGQDDEEADDSGDGQGRRRDRRARVAPETAP